jgi:hypothetical protein
MNGWTKMGFAWWPQRKWTFLVDEDIARSKTTFVLPGKPFLYDARGTTFFAVFGAVADPQVANVYLKTHLDGGGQGLEGSRTYTLHVPPDVPASQFWSVDVYDLATCGFFREASVVGVNSHDPKLEKNADGSVDIYFGPRPPARHQTNWIFTAPGKGWFPIMRFYGPQKPIVDKSWVLNDIERTN